MDMLQIRKPIRDTGKSQTSNSPEEKQGKGYVWAELSLEKGICISK